MGLDHVERDGWSNFEEGVTRIFRKSCATKFLRVLHANVIFVGFLVEKAEKRQKTRFLGGVEKPEIWGIFLQIGHNRRFLRFSGLLKNQHYSHLPHQIIQ